MYALTKTPVSRQTAESIAAENFNRQSLAACTELTDGMFNSAYLLELSGGQKVVLKVAPPEQVRVLQYEKNILRAEVDVLRLLRARTSVPVPEVLAYDTSRRLLQNDYFLMSYIPGQGLHKLRAQVSAQVSAHLPAENLRAVDRRVGEYVRQINAIQGPVFGYFAQPAFHFPTWRAAFSAMLEQVLRDGRQAGVELPLPYESLSARLQPFYPALEEVTSPALVHWDMWDGNIFVDPQTLAVTGILDCERALWGDPLMEVNFGAFGFNADFLEGYGADLLASPGARQRRKLYNIYLWLIMIIECTYRQFENHDQENWARGKLLEELDKLG